MKKVNIFCHSFQSEPHILYRFITQSEIFQAFISWNLDYYGLQMMKTPNSVSQKIRILYNINKKNDILNRNVRLLKSMFISMHSILVGPPFAWITASIRRGMEPISLWHCSGVMEAQVALIMAFRSSAFLGLVSHLPLDNNTIDYLRGSGQASLLASQAQ